jgi:DNA mismatch endonuclease (patch repair protein)
MRSQRVAALKNDPLDGVILRSDDSDHRRSHGGSLATSEGVRRSMRTNNGRDTSPELAVRRILHARGLRYRVNFRPIAAIRSRPDIAFTRAKVAIYVDGCFWHGCPIHATVPKTNVDYWSPKLERNRERDKQATASFEKSGWRVLRFWEHETPTEMADAIEMRYAAQQQSRNLSGSARREGVLPDDDPGAG